LLLKNGAGEDGNINGNGDGCASFRKG